MPTTWPSFLDWIGAPLIIEPSVDHQSGDAGLLSGRRFDRLVVCGTSSFSNVEGLVMWGS